MLKEAINIGKARFKQVKTPVTGKSLVDLGFTQVADVFSMGDFDVTFISGNFYYKSPEYQYVKIKNMYVLSNLIYGKVEYGR